MEVVAEVTDASGYIATDSTVYATLTLLKAAGKTAFPGRESSGQYPTSLTVTSIAAAGGAGDGFTFATNGPDALPSSGFRSQGGGQQIVVNGVSPISAQPISNVALVSKVTGTDHIRVVAEY